MIKNCDEENENIFGIRSDIKANYILKTRKLILFKIRKRRFIFIDCIKRGYNVFISYICKKKEKKSQCFEIYYKIFFFLIFL